jgi:4-amino-4-deoxy-L-arabinose transferase-like glycosyltransferase
VKAFLDDLAGDRHARTMLVVATLAAALVLRAASLGTYPLTDTTEARYGDIARVMLETGDWLSPRDTPDTVFWAKPPLVAWASAASMAALGVNEFAARLPSLGFALATCWLVAVWARATAPPDASAARERGLIAAAVLATSVLFYVSAGAVMTDPGLACFTTWMLVAFHRSVVVAPGAGRPPWRWGFFVAAGLAMLAKGPVVIVYAGLPIVAWALLTRQVGHTWRALPWGRGALLCAALWLPWYLVAEARTPGFLRYFLLGEHVLRFIEPGWRGDLYGRAHTGARGMIWLHLLAALGPWALALPALLPARRQPAASSSAPADGSAFLWIATLAPLAFFTLSRNLIWTYALPVLAPVAVLLAVAIEPRVRASRRWQLVFVTFLPLPLAAFAVGSIAWLPGEAAKWSTRALVAAWQQEVASEPGPLVYWGPRTPHSLSFYSAGRASRLYHDAPEPPPADPIFVLVDGARVGELTTWIDRHLPGRVVEIVADNGPLRLMEVSATADPGEDGRRRRR